MNEFSFHNKITFYETEENRISFSFWISLILSMCILSSCIIEIRLSNEIFAVYQEETKTLEIFWPLEKIENLSKYEILRMEGKNYEIKIKNRKELLIDDKNHQNLQKIELESPKELQSNQIIKIYLLDKKEKFIKKILKMLQKGG